MSSSQRICHNEDKLKANDRSSSRAVNRFVLIICIGGFGSPWYFVFFEDFFFSRVSVLYFIPTGDIT